MKIFVKKYFVIILLIVGIFFASIILFSTFQLNLNQEKSSKIDTETVNPEEVCIDLVDMGFSSESECVNFVNGMLTKIKDYSKSIDCKDHQLLFNKLGIECS